jgi:hypothetical protein
MLDPKLPAKQIDLEVLIADICDVLIDLPPGDVDEAFEDELLGLELSDVCDLDIAAAARDDAAKS